MQGLLILKWIGLSVPKVIVEIGSNTGRTTEEIGLLFPQSKVIGIEWDALMFEFARTYHTKKCRNVAYARACIWQPDFWSQLLPQIDLKEQHFVDAVITTHYLHIEHPNIETIMDNIARLLTPGL